MENPYKNSIPKTRVKLQTLVKQFFADKSFAIDLAPRPGLSP